MIRGTNKFTTKRQRGWGDKFISGLEKHIASKMQLTFRGFDTPEDAKTFQRFLLLENYTGVSLEYDIESRLWRVYFKI